MVTENQPQRGLIVGNYCHDVLFNDGVVTAETLGGASSFISAVLDGLSSSCHVSSKVGPDFAYARHVSIHPPILTSSLTTLFHAHFCSSPKPTCEDRILKRIQSCEPILPSDLPSECWFNFGMAVGVGGEIIPQTLEKMMEMCDIVFADVQSLIRTFDEDGTVRLVRLEESGFFHLLPRLGFLKASAEEAPWLDVDEARKCCCVVITKGKDGCTLYWKDGERQIPPLSAVQVDPTGAGDCFFGGFAAGLVHGGLSVPNAALLGNFFGSLTVAHIGIPMFDTKLMQQVREEMQRRKTRNSCAYGDIMKPALLVGHDDEFYTYLASAAAVSKINPQKSPAIIQQQL